MYGVNNKSLKWFEDYLTNRSQKTKVNGELSSTREIECGVPQGSVLGPLLFIVYVNDIGRYITELKVSLYADGTALYTSGENYIDIILNVRIDLESIIQWLRANQLLINVKKTKYN